MGNEDSLEAVFLFELEEDLVEVVLGVEVGVVPASLKDVGYNLLVGALLQTRALPSPEVLSSQLD